MGRRGWRGRVLFLTIAVAFAAARAQAQSPLDTPLKSGDGRSLVIRGVDSVFLSNLAAAAGLPFGLIGAPQTAPAGFAIDAAGRTLRHVLDALVAADPRYEWRDEGGLVLVHAVAGADGIIGWLDAPTAGVTLTDTTSADALGAIARMTGTTSGPGPGDTKRFACAFPPGTTLRDVLDGIVRAHGTLTWAVTPSTYNYVDFPVMVQFAAGGSGTGFGVARRRFERREFAAAPAFVGRGEPAASAIPLLDRIVRPSADGSPINTTGIFAQTVVRLAEASGVPMGIEISAQSIARPDEPITLTGLTLRDALGALSRLDPRYEIRDMNGIVVFRPVGAWADPEDTLFRLVPGVDIEDRPLSAVLEKVQGALGVPRPTVMSVGDGRPLTLMTPQESALDLLNAVVRAHGELSWTLEPNAPNNVQDSARQHTLTFYIFGAAGFGFAIP